MDHRHLQASANSHRHRWLGVAQRPRSRVPGVDVRGVGRPGVGAHACNPSTLRGRGEWITCVQELETSLANILKPLRSSRPVWLT